MAAAWIRWVCWLLCSSSWHLKWAMDAEKDQYQKLLEIEKEIVREVAGVDKH